MRTSTTSLAMHQLRQQSNSIATPLTVAGSTSVLGKDTILIGNIQYDDLARLSVDEIDQLVRLAIEEGRSGKFILSPSAGPYETTLTEKQVENYLAFIHAGVKYGQLSQRNK